jgi:hypothetical protein
MTALVVDKDVVAVVITRLSDAFFNGEQIGQALLVQFFQ